MTCTVFLRPPQGILHLAGSLRDYLGPLGIISRRVDIIHSLAQGFANHTLQFDDSAPTDKLIQQLDDLPSIDPWTAGYLAMRGVHDTDAVPAKDLGILKALQALSVLCSIMFMDE